MPRHGAATPKIAIIGGGASAVLLLGHLAQYCDERSGVFEVFDRSGKFARGVAYSTQREGHLLNVRAEDLSAYAHEPSHFAEWAKNLGYQASAFLPRKRYGDYLETILRKAQQKLAINLIRDDITACEKTAGSYALRTASADVRTYDAAVLASGNVRALGCTVAGSPVGYFEDPWTVNDAFLRGTKQIALIGSGLTAIDALLSLRDINYSGNITLISRRALLPATHTVPASWPYDPSGTPHQSPLFLLRQIREEITLARTRNIPWQAVIDSRRHAINAIWHNFSPSERRQFMRHLYTLWGAHRHRMAPEVADTVRFFKDQKRLHAIMARVSEIQESGTGVRLHLSSGAAHDFDAAINCMGYRYDEPDRAYEVSARLGPARFGELFETTAIPEIRAQAATLAQHLAQRLRTAGDTKAEAS